jgi:probable HAF family extracellular repeat protein
MKFQPFCSHPIPLKNRLITIYSIVLITGFAYASPRAQAQTYSFTTYTVTDLGTLPGPKIETSTPAAINGQAQVAGTSGYSAFRYTSIKEPMEDVGSNPADSVSRGFGINASGQVVGDSTFGGSDSISHAAIFEKGSAANLVTLKEGGPYSRANGINASGQVVGFYGSELDSSASRAFIWSVSTGMLDLGTLGGAYAQAYAINDSGFVTGNSQPAESKPGVTHAFICRPFSITNRAIKGMRDLGTLGGRFSYGTFINADNHVVGYSTISNSDNRLHAFLHDGTKMRDLGSLGGKSLESDQSFALGINSVDEVVGFSYLPGKQVAFSSTGWTAVPQQVAFVYSQGLMMNLNELIDGAAKSYRLFSATAINDKGQIVASALDYNTNAMHALLLTPTGIYIPVSNGDRSTRAIRAGKTQ